MPDRRADGDVPGGRNRRETDRAEWLREVYERHGARMYSVAVRLTGSEADAEDVLQEIFLGLIDKFESHRADAPLGAWLQKITVRESLMLMRGERRRRRREDRWARSRDGPADAGRRITDGIDLDRVLRRLPPDLRVILVLKDVEGYSHKEIATMVGIAPSTSMTRLTRARKLVREWLGGGRPRVTNPGTCELARWAHGDANGDLADAIAPRRAVPCLPARGGTIGLW